jgi:hypothetical protein
MTEDNRRRYPRYRHRTAVQLTLGQTVEEVHTGDVSLQGLFLHVQRAPLLRSLVRVRLMIPDGPMEAVGVVVRVVHPSNEGDPVGVGVQFMTLEPAVDGRWRRFLDQLGAADVPQRTTTAPRQEVPVATERVRRVTATRMQAVSVPEDPVLKASPGAGAPRMSTDSDEMKSYVGITAFRIRPPRIEEVAALFDVNLMGGTVLLDGVPLLEPGTQVKVDVVHPLTGNTLTFEAHVFSATPGGRLAVSLAPLNDTRRYALAAFLAEVPTRETLKPMRSLPPLPPLRAPMPINATQS